jgi:hypothetical protein
VESTHLEIHKSSLTKVSHIPPEAVARVQGKASFTICESLALQVDRACISGRSVFVSLDHDNLPTPQQKPVTSN